MKHMTQNEINTLKSLIEEKRNHLRGIMNDLEDLQKRLHASTTVREVKKLKAEFNETAAMAEKELAFIQKAQKEIAKFYRPAA